MTTALSHSANWLSTRKSFDSLVDRVVSSRLSFEEADILRDSHWSLGEDARLREDVRFRPTPWRRWILASSYLANDAIFARLHREPLHRIELEETLKELYRVVKRRCVICPADPRIVLDRTFIRLSAQELTNQPLVEKEINDIEKYVTHLPLHSLLAAAASAPAGQWGRRAQEQMIETPGWVRVSLPGRKLNARMFVARIEGHSMDDGRSGLVDGGYAVFELWPSGTKQFLNVLVRGAFSDPETGNYAVKKYVADQRGKDGRHRRVSLVSLNPDKERFPDIELDVAGEDDVTVVAKAIHPLSADEFARKPKPVKRPGRRDLLSSESIAEIVDNLEEYTEKFFEALPTEYEADEKIARQAWSAQLVCLEAEAGGLHIEAGPLGGLWSFVKQLRVKGPDWETVVLAANLRHRPIRVPVPATAGPYSWVAKGFEDDPDVDFSTLTVSALQPDRAHLFRLDAADIGRMVSSTTLSVGQCYRILLPEKVYNSLDHKPAANSAGSGWKIWELSLSVDKLAGIQGALNSLGLQVGEPDARLEWVLAPPVAWRITPRGAPYACFLPTHSPVVSVSGPNVDIDGAACLFLHGPRGTQTYALPSGQSHLVRLEGLLPGRYSVLLLHDRTRVAPERLAFEIVSETPFPPAAAWRLTLGSEVVAPQPGSIWVGQSRDLGGLESASAIEPLLRLEAPPGWPVRVIWRELAEDLILTTQADREGLLDGSDALTASRERRTRRSIGDLVFDLAELGAAVFRHERRPTPEAIRTRVAELVASRGATVQRLSGAYSELLPIWFEPLCAALGYDVELVAADDMSDAPIHVSVSRLIHTERHGTKIERHPVRVLLLVEDLQQGLSDAFLGWIDEVCAAQKLRDVLVSDGLCWAGHRRTSRLAPPVWDLSAVSSNAEDFLSFLRVAAEGV